MYKAFVLAISLTLGLGLSAAAQGDPRFETGGSGDAGNTWDNAPTSDVTMTQGNSSGSFFVPPPSTTSTQKTRQNSYQGVLNRLPAPNASPFSSQSATGMPIPGTYIAPANLALQTQFGMFGNPILPKTNLDSFVAQSGYNDLIYGDEGIDDIPPYFVFDESHRIERGIHSADLSTGHRSDAPEAWGWPF
ncbi:MAG TPA: hypothetical protein V6D22_00045 [Candidatus Obscuribacterales bacterium]